MLSIATRHGLAALLLLTSGSVAAMEAMSEDELGAVTGAGVGFFVDNFLYDQGTATAQIGGLKDSSGGAVTIDVTRGYIKGEGSRRGQDDVLASIGSPAHPFTLGVVSGLDAPTLPVGQQALQLKTPTYSDPLNDTRQYGLWAYYQGCVYGEAGCADANAANTSIAAENAALQASRTTLQNKYQSVGFLSLKSGIDADKVIVDQRQTTVNSKTAQAVVATNNLNNTYAAAPSRYYASSDPLHFFPYDKPDRGEQYSCPFGCPQAVKDYNNSIDPFNTAQSELSAAQKSLSEAWGVQRNGVTLIQRYADYDAFVALCGVPTQESPTCTDGSIAQGQADQLIVGGVASALNGGGKRVKGLDLGLETTFTVPSVAYAQNGTAGATTNRKDFFNIYVHGLTLHGSYLNIWGNDQGLQAETSLQFYINRVALDGCQPGLCLEGNRAIAKNVYFDLNLGNAKYQPLNFKMDANGEVNLSLPAVTWANHAAFYSNVQKSNISVGNLSFGNGHDVNGVARPRTDVGAQIVQGMRLDYFEFKSTNLPR